MMINKTDWHLNKRLKIISQWIQNTKANNILDLGTDHAILAKQLAITTTKQIFASDLRSHIILKHQKQALKKPIKNLQFIISDGFKKIPPTIELIIIAGIGPQKIEKIIHEAPKLYSEYIIQTRKNPNNLRKFFAKHKFGIKKDYIINENQKYYHTLWFSLKNIEKLNKNYQFSNKKFWNKNFFQYWKKQLIINQKIYSKLLKKDQLIFYREKILPIKEIIKYDEI